MRKASECVLVFVNHCSLGGRQDCVLNFRLLNKILVEVGEVVLHARHVGRRDLLSLERVQVQIGKPRVLQDFLDAVSSETILAVLVQKFADQVLSLWRHRDAMALWIGEAYGALTD